VKKLSIHEWQEEKGKIEKKNGRAAVKQGEGVAVPSRQRRITALGKVEKHRPKSGKRRKTSVC